MAGNTLAVDIVAKTTGLTAGLAQATAQIDTFSASVNKAADTQAAVTGEQSLRTQAMTTAQVWVASRRAMIDAETRANTLLRAGRKADVASLGDALATMEQRRDAFLQATRAYYDGMTGVQQTAFAAQEAAANREMEAEYQRLAARLDDATAIQTETAALEENTVATAVNGSTAREATYMLDEIASGRFRRLGGSSVVLANRMGLLSSIFSPLGLSIAGTAVAVGTLGVAMIEGERNADALNAAILSTNDAMGITRGRFDSMAAAIAGGDITIGAARGALLALAQSGRFTGSTLQEAAQAAVDFADLTDSSMKQATQAVEQLAQRPLTAVVKLNDQLHFLTAAEYQQIAALEQEGHATAAAKAAIDDLGTAMHARTEQAVRDEGTIVRVWEEIKGAIDSAVGRAEQLGAHLSVGDKIRKMHEEIAMIHGSDSFDAGARQKLEGELQVLQAEERQHAALARQKSAQDQINAAGVRAAAYLDKQVASLKTVNVEMAHQRELTAQIEALHKASPNDSLLKGDTFNAQGHLTKGNSTYDQLIANIQQKFASHPMHITFAGITGGNESTSGVTQMLAADRTILEAAQRSATQRERIAEQVNSIEEAAASRHSQAMLQIHLNQLRIEEAQGRITHAQELSQAQQFYQQTYAAEMMAYQRELAVDAQKPAAKAAIYAQIEALHDKYVAHMTDSSLKAAHAQAAAFQATLAPITAAFDTSINGIIQGTQTMQMAIANILDSILLKYIDLGIEKTINWIATENQMTAVSVASEAYRLALKEAAAAKALIIKTMTAAKSIAIDAAEAGAAAFKAVVGIPYVGPILAVAAAATAVMEVKKYASFDMGAWSIPHDMHAVVHQGEMILPRPFAEDARRNGFIGEGGAGGGDTHIHIHTPDVDSFNQLLMNNSDGVAAAAMAAHRNGAFR